MRGLGKTYADIARLFGISAQRARQIVVKAERLDREAIREIVKEEKKYMGRCHVKLEMLLWSANEVANGQ